MRSDGDAMGILKNRKKAEITREPDVHLRLVAKRSGMVKWLCSLDAASAGGLKE
jgi:hypothetical protein